MPARAARYDRRVPEKARLRIYIGAAPGVGKTYSMIEDAHALRREGVDVVVGFVETHGRAETDAKFYKSLKMCCQRLRPLVDPRRELATWRRLLSEFQAR